MTPGEHYAEAERLLEFADGPSIRCTAEGDQALEAAKVHATLARTDVPDLLAEIDRLRAGIDPEHDHVIAAAALGAAVERLSAADCEPAAIKMIDNLAAEVLRGEHG